MRFNRPCTEEELAGRGLKLPAGTDTEEIRSVRSLYFVTLIHSEDESSYVSTALVDKTCFEELDTPSRPVEQTLQQCGASSWFRPSSHAKTGQQRWPVR